MQGRHSVFFQGGDKILTDSLGEKAKYEEKKMLCAETQKNHYCSNSGGHMPPLPPPKWRPEYMKVNVRQIHVPNMDTTPHAAQQIKLRPTLPDPSAMPFGAMNIPEPSKTKIYCIHNIIVWYTHSFCTVYTLVCMV